MCYQCMGATITINPEVHIYISTGDLIYQSNYQKQDDRLMYIPNNDIQKYSLCRLKLLVQKFRHW